MTTSSPAYSSVVTLTITLTGLASDTSLIAGRQSTALDQKDTDDAIDVMVGGKTTTGSSPTATRQIDVASFASYDDATFSAGAGASDSNFSPTGEKSLMRPIESIPTDGTSDHVYEWGPWSLSQVWGNMPVQWGIFQVHNTGVNLNATATNHNSKYFPLKYENA